MISSLNVTFSYHVKFGALQFDFTEQAKILYKCFTKFVFSNSIVSLSMAHI